MSEKDYYEKNREIILNRAKEYYINNKELIKDYQKEYQKEYRKNMTDEQKKKIIKKLEINVKKINIIK